MADGPSVASKNSIAGRIEDFADKHPDDRLVVDYEHGATAAVRFSKRLLAANVERHRSEKKSGENGETSGVAIDAASIMENSSI